jgi:signal transduction histidine kinase
LAIAKRAVERVGGGIAIDSAPGYGTAVTITL